MARLWTKRKSLSWLTINRKRSMLLRTQFTLFYTLITIIYFTRELFSGTDTSENCFCTQNVTQERTNLSMQLFFWCTYKVKPQLYYHRSVTLATVILHTMTCLTTHRTVKKRKLEDTHVRPGVPGQQDHRYTSTSKTPNKCQVLFKVRQFIKDTENQERIVISRDMTVEEMVSR